MNHQKLAEMRRRMGMTQVAMADYLEVSERHYRDMEKGRLPIGRPLSIMIAIDWHKRCRQEAERPNLELVEAEALLAEEVG
jgi:DNA-binding XRE family transcriptional regulator